MGRVAFLDLETNKIRLPTEYRPPHKTNPDHRLVTLRWQVFMAGLSLDTSSDIIIYDQGSEEHILTQIWRYLDSHKVTTIVYEATHSFDEAICRGVFINARRRLLAEPGPWPHMPECDTFIWKNLGPKPVKNPDGLGKDAWVTYQRDPELIRQHCEWDVRSMKERYFSEGG